MSAVVGKDYEEVVRLFSWMTMLRRCRLQMELRATYLRFGQKDGAEAVDRLAEEN
jgi:hypothetical protein